MENMDLFKGKVTNLYHLLIGLRNMRLFEQRIIDNEQLYEMACDAVNAEDEYFTNWLSKTQGLLADNQKDPVPEGNGMSKEMKLDLVFLQKVLMKGHITIKLSEDDEAPIAVLAKRFMEKEGYEFSDPTLGHLLDQACEAVSQECELPPYRTLIFSGDSGTLNAIDHFNSCYYKLYSHLLYSCDLVPFSFGIKEETRAVKHLFADCKIFALEKTMAHIKDQMKEAQKTDMKLTMELMVKHQECMKERNYIMKYLNTI